MRWVAASLLIVASTAAAQPLTVEDRLDRLEAEVRVLREENERLRVELQTRAPGNDAAPNPAPAPSRKAPAVEISGLVQAQGEAGGAVDSRFPEEDRFLMRRARITATGALTQAFDYKVELDLGGSLSPGSDLRAQLTDGFVTWRRFSQATLRLGQFKTPFGYEQIYSDSRLLTPERTLASDRLTLGRQVGLQLAGELLDERLAYSLGAFNGSGANNNFNDNDSFVVAGRLSGTLFQGGAATAPARWTGGINALTTSDSGVRLGSDFRLDSTPGTPARDNLFSGDRTGFGLDTQLSVGRFDLWAEYLRQRFEPESRLPLGKFTAEGWYAQAAMFVVPARLQLVAKYELLDPVSALPGAETATWTTGINYYIRNHDLKLQIHYLSSDLPGDAGTENRLLARVQTAF
jgi:phosphate-selective porin OprO and OprP